MLRTLFLLANMVAAPEPRTCEGRAREACEHEIDRGVEICKQRRKATCYSALADDALRANEYTVAEAKFFEAASALISLGRLIASQGRSAAEVAARVREAAERATSAVEISASHEGGVSHGTVQALHEIHRDLVALLRDYPEVEALSQETRTNLAVLTADKMAGRADRYCKEVESMGNGGIGSRDVEGRTSCLIMTGRVYLEAFSSLRTTTGDARTSERKRRFLLAGVAAYFDATDLFLRSSSHPMSEDVCKRAERGVAYLLENRAIVPLHEPSHRLLNARGQVLSLLCRARLIDVDDASPETYLVAGGLYQRALEVLLSEVEDDSRRLILGAHSEASSADWVVETYTSSFGARLRAIALSRQSRRGRWTYLSWKAEQDLRAMHTSVLEALAPGPALDRVEAVSQFPTNDGRRRPFAPEGDMIVSGSALLGVGVSGLAVGLGLLGTLLRLECPENMMAPCEDNERWPFNKSTEYQSNTIMAGMGLSVSGTLVGVAGGAILWRGLRLRNRQRSKLSLSNLGMLGIGISGRF